MKLAIIGTGKIVHEALFAMEPLPQISKTAIFARPHSREKGEALASQYGIAEIYTDYDRLLAEADADTVYIGLVNSAHYPYAKKALESGKNVILEKPFTGTYAQACELRDIAFAGKLMLLEAITVLHSDVFDKMQSDLPKLGKVRMMLANFSQYSSRYDNYLKGEVAPAFDPALQGGALRDIDIYNIHYAVALFGIPLKTQYYANRGFNGVDTSGTLVMQYDGFSAVCTCAKDSDSPCYVCIQGEQGWMRIDGKPNIAPNLTTVCVDPSGGESVPDPSGGRKRPLRAEEFCPEPPHHRMTREFRDFARIIDENDYNAASEYLNESVDVMRTLEEAADQ